MAHVSIEERIGGHVAEMRQRHGLTQEQLGQRIGEITGRAWSRQAVHSAEKGNRAFAVADLVTMAYALDTVPAALMGGDVVMPTPDDMLSKGAEKVDVLAGLINLYTGDNELNDQIAGALAPHVALAGEPDPLLVEIRDLLRSIDGKLSPPHLKKGKHVKLGRVFSTGHTIPDDVDLVVGASGVRWKRVYNDMRVPLDQWYPRDGDGPVVSGNVLIAQNGHVTEIPAPGSEAQA